MGEPQPLPVLSHIPQPERQDTMTDDLESLANTLQDRLTDVGSLVRAISGGPRPPLARTEVKAGDSWLIVSTVDTADCGPETAIMDGRGAHPVERYATVEDALVGHRRWVAKLEAGEREVAKLGYGTSIQPKTVVLVPVDGL